MIPLQIVFWLSLAGVALVMAGYPLFAALAGVLFSGTRKSSSARQTPPPLPTVAVLTVCRDPGELLAAKIENSFRLVYPPDKLSMLVVLDGVRAGEAARLEALKRPGLRFMVAGSPPGKNHALNLGVANIDSDVILFSDLDALLEPGALMALVLRLLEPGVGGVSGQRVIADTTAGSQAMRGGQSGYIGFDSRIKRAENRLGAITGNDGKCYAIWRRLARPVLPSSVDDIYNLLNIVEQGQAFLFEPEARAAIRTPSRSARHELQRRRRIVNRSLSGILHRPRLLASRRFGGFGPRLVVNKIFRRMLPIFLILLAASSLLLAPFSLPALLALLAQAGFYGLALLHVLLNRLPGGGLLRFPRKKTAPFAYFCVGNAGILLGLLSRLRGERIESWTPIKQDAEPN